MLNMPCLKEQAYLIVANISALIEQGAEIDSSLSQELDTVLKAWCESSPAPSREELIEIQEKIAELTALANQQKTALANKMSAKKKGEKAVSAYQNTGRR
jgi:hypothetical protein